MLFLSFSEVKLFYMSLISKQCCQNFKQQGCHTLIVFQNAGNFKNIVNLREIQGNSRNLDFILNSGKFIFFKFQGSFMIVINLRKIFFRSGMRFIYLNFNVLFNKLILSISKCFLRFFRLVASSLIFLEIK